ncbi:MAG: hypothetical protein JSU92_14990 [Deltaproteobacteria bacterium]|nr:MAG: hypothetical protein JSU92_14990 [Deltaproteobacteria bacterium]
MEKAKTFIVIISILFLTAGFVLAGVEGAYHSYSETSDELDDLVITYPDLAQVSSLGLTFEGRDIWALKISEDVSVDTDLKPDILVSGCHHAREWITVEVSLYIANYLLSQYYTDDEVKFLVDKAEIWVVPIVNPDGLYYSQDVADDTHRLWRKNRRVHVIDSTEYTGIDLNRNYDFKWRLPGDDPYPDIGDDYGASDHPANILYRGPSTASESEVQAVQNLLLHPDHNFQMITDYHNYGQLLLYSWGYSSAPTPDNSTLATLSTEMAQRIKAVHNRTYTPKQSFYLYPTTGITVDYSYGAQSILAITTELRPPGYPYFKLPENEIEPTNEENLPAALYLIDWALGPAFLKRIEVTQDQDGDGTFDDLIYQAQWDDLLEGETTRTLAVTESNRGMSGEVRFRLIFSEPMRTDDGGSPLEPVVTMGKTSPYDTHSISSSTSFGGWAKTDYQNDTWEGWAILPEDGSIDGTHTVSVSAQDLIENELDGTPVTLAFYEVGADHWSNYEDETGADSHLGGKDQIHNTLIFYFDYDNDGMSDAWESRNGLDPNTDDASEDPDNDGRDNLTEYLEGTNPQVWDNPIEGACVKSSNFIVWGSASDAHGIVQVQVSLDGGVPIITDGTTNWSVALNGITDGPHTLVVTAIDGCGGGNPGVTSPTGFLVDTQPPIISITSPTDGATVYTSTVTVVGTIGDSGSGPQSTVAVKLDGGIETQTVPVSEDTFAAIFTGLSEGSHTFLATGSDWCGNKADSPLINVVIKTGGSF